MTKRHATALGVAVIVVAGALAVSAVAAAAHSSRAPATTKIRVSGGEFFFKLSARSAHRGTITFVFKNVGHVGHDLKIAGKKTPIIQPGKTATLVAKLTKPGKYPYSCTVPGHAQAGMRGVFKVT